MPLDDESLVERQHLIDQAAILVSVVDHDRVDPNVDVDEIEMQVRDPAQTLAPVPSQRRLATDDAARSPLKNSRQRRCPEIQ